ncbi:MAG: rhodanese-like domain-containing protein [Planctomycetota bacterium]
MTTFRRSTLGTALFASAIVLSMGCSQQTVTDRTPVPGVAGAVDTDGFTTFINASEALSLVEAAGDELVLIDARKPDAYAKGHLSGAINLPPNVWRTPKTKPGEGPSRHFYREGADDSGPLDAAYYNRALGAAGLSADAPVLVYGNHAGKGDGSVPVMVLHLLGHQGKVYFLDGVGTQRLTEAGFVLATASAVRPATTYTAQPKDDAVWDLADVKAYVDNPDPSVVLWDNRTPEEWDGTEKRGNARGGHVPGSVYLGFSDLFTPGEAKTVLEREAMKNKLVSAGITPDKTVVIYCQTSTRVALPYQALREMGYDKVAIYDGSMSEYANLDDTKLELP